MDVQKIFDQIKHVAIETMNRCNYGHIHKKCPASKVKTTVTLPQRCVFDVIDTLGARKYAKAVSFYHYSESLIEPRLFMFIKYARAHCGDAMLFAGTNGLMLTQELALELYDVGIDCILVSAYTKSEDKRIKAIKQKIKGHPVTKNKSLCIRTRGALDDRLAIQGAPCDAHKNRTPCTAPLSEVIVRANGEMPLCCADIDCSFGYGNVTTEKFGSVLEKQYGKLKLRKDELSKGKRTLSICKNCFYKNRWHVDNMKSLFGRGKF